MPGSMDGIIAESHSPDRPGHGDLLVGQSGGRSET
jgi:hypothetical protein